MVPRFARSHCRSTAKCTSSPLDVGPMSRDLLRVCAMCLPQEILLCQKKGKVLLGMFEKKTLSVLL